MVQFVMSSARRRVLRERNEISLTNFDQSLRTLFLQIQQLNSRKIEPDQLEITRLHLDDAMYRQSKVTAY